MSIALSVRTHLRRAWDQLFLPGTVGRSSLVGRYKCACYRAGINVIAEYRENYPAPGLSGVLLTRLPKASPNPRNRNLTGNRAAGL